MGKIEPKVTVLVMTYNHENFIEQAVESVLMQEVSFEVEIIISEDCSTDRTREIVIGFQQRYPGRIQLLLSERNLHSNEIVVRGLQKAKGQYIALLDGDDYWISPLKLQKQVDFLDRHPECAICFHNATVNGEDESFEPWNWTGEHQKEISTLEDIWMGNFIATCSTMFRRGLFGDVPDWYISLFPITDWPLHLLNAEHGKIGYIPEVMGIYRYHRGGLYSPYSEARKQEETLKLFRTMNRNFDFRYNEIVNVAISRYFFEWAEEYAQRRDYEKARSCLWTSLSGRPVNQFISFRKLIKTWLKIYGLSLFSIMTKAHPLGTNGTKNNGSL